MIKQIPPKILSLLVQQLQARRYGKSLILVASLSFGFVACKTTSGTTVKGSGKSSDGDAQQGQGLANASVSASGLSGVQAAWVQLGAGTTVLIKAITTDTQNCPVATVDGKPLSLLPRSKDTSVFQVLVCEAALPSGAQNASLGAQTLHIPKAAPQRIVIIGDTGCRIKTENNKLQLQDCNNPANWPLPQVASAVAAAQADLIIHVGDYHYREEPCPPGNDECTPSFSGDTWPSWQQDLFSPALVLLESAPLLLTRGNHEDCSRSGAGWFYFLDPLPYNPTCSNKVAPYWVTVGDHRIAMIDSADDKNMQTSFNQLQPQQTGGLVWWVTHRPFLSAGADDELTGPAPTLPAAWAGAGVLNAVFTGHEHRLAYHSFPSTSWPPELINGNGSTFLDSGKVAGQTYEPVTEQNYTGVEWFNFGFATLDRQAGGWAMTARDQSGTAVINCTFSEAPQQQSTFSCTPTARAAVAPAPTPKEDLSAKS